MPNLTSVTVTAGIPTVGTGTVSTLDALMADGGQVTIGAKADAKASTTDTTPVTLMSVLKQISFSIQAAAASLAGTLTVAAHAVTNAGTFAVQAAQSGTWTVQPGNTANTTAWKVDGSAVTQPVSIASGSGFYTEDAAAAADPVGAIMMGVRRDTLSTSEVSADGDNIAVKCTSKGELHTRNLALEALIPGLGQQTVAASQSMTLASNHGRLPGEPQIIHVAGTAMTRPANTTAYSALDAISDNTTAGSVTANSVTLSGVNDDPISIEEILLVSTDTGFGGKSIRIYLYNANPTSSSGVVGGDNAAFSNKQAGFIGTMIGAMLAFSDGSRGRFVPEAGSRLLSTPTSGAKTIFWQLQTLDAATPSANSTTFTPTFKCLQGRAS